MPTVILLDVSLSMSRIVKQHRRDGNFIGEDLVELKQLANVGIGTLLDYFAQNAQLEHTALVIFSSLWEIKHEFTRHHESIKNGIYDLELFDKSNVVNAVRGALSLKLSEWSQSGPVNLVLITDGLVHDCNILGINLDEPRGSHDRFHDIPLSELEGQFDFPCKMQVVCLSAPTDPNLKQSIPFYKNLISKVDSSANEDCPILNSLNQKNFKQSAIWLPDINDSEISIESVERLFTNIAESHYRPHHTILTCGHLSSMVMLSPKPSDCLVEPLKNEFDDLVDESIKETLKETYVRAINKVRRYKLNNEISICGFMPLAEIASPAVTSRHLVLPILHNDFNETLRAEQVLTRDPRAYSRSNLHLTMDDETSAHQTNGRESMDVFLKISSNADNKTSQQTTSKTITNNATGGESSKEIDITKQPSFCVLLFNALKAEDLVAMCIVGRNDESGEDWYGMLYSQIDSRKRSSLMLSLLTPGQCPISWLPNFRYMGSGSLFKDVPAAIRDRMNASNRNTVKSYSSNSVIWLDPESVQADVQKIIRHAKRGPDKAPHFYKELNRIRKAAISYGFLDVLYGLVSILERERRIMQADQSKYHPETLKHIDHVINCLKTNVGPDSYDTNITPPVL